MFSYIDPDIQKLLEDQGKMITIGPEPDRADSADEDGIRPDTGQVNLLGPIPLPVVVGDTDHEFAWYPFVRRTQHEQVLAIARGLQKQTDLRGLSRLLVAQMTVNSLLVYGDLGGADAPLVRVHSCCMTGEVFGSLRCECGPQLAEAYRRIVAEGCGAIVYMAGHEGRGIGLWAKGITYILQDQGRNTYDANRALNLPDDSRDFRDAALVLRHFLKPPPTIRLLSNNPLKRTDLTNHGVAVAAVERLVVGVNRYNLRYLHAKRDHGHTTGELPDSDADVTADADADADADR